MGPIGVKATRSRASDQLKSHWQFLTQPNLPYLPGDQDDEHDDLRDRSAVLTLFDRLVFARVLDKRRALNHYSFASPAPVPNSADSRGKFGKHSDMLKW